VKRLPVTDIIHYLAGMALVATTFGPTMTRAQSTNVITWHNNIGRTGQNTTEQILTQSNVTRNSFGRRCSAALDGMVYAQPLVVSNVLFQGQTTPKTNRKYRARAPSSGDCVNGLAHPSMLEMGERSRQTGGSTGCNENTQLAPSEAIAHRRVRMEGWRQHWFGRNLERLPPFLPGGMVTDRSSPSRVR
jgi:hypothetical protein